MKFFRASSVIGPNGKTAEPKVETFVPNAHATESGEFIATLPNGGTIGAFNTEEDAIRSAEESLVYAGWHNNEHQAQLTAQRLADERNVASRNRRMQSSGGRARAAKLTPEQRSASALKAVQARETKRKLNQ